MNMLNLTICTTLLGLSFRSSAATVVMSQPEIYERCHMLMVRALPEEGDTLLAQVMAGTITGTNACMALLERAKFVTSNHIDQPADPTAVAIVKTFHDFHGSWFSSRSSGSYSYGAGRLISDDEEPSLFITKALLDPATPYRSVVTSGTPLRGIRRRADASAGGTFMAQNIVRYPPDIPALVGTDHLIAAYLDTSAVPRVVRGINIVDYRLVSVGDLIGVQENPIFTFPRTQLVPLNDTLPASVIQAVTSQVDINQNHGGGILGSQAFLLQNGTTELNEVAKTEESINRTAMARAFETLLCHELPTLRATDVTVVPASPFPFQRSTSCLTCHSQLDPAAHTLRNLALTLSAPVLRRGGANEVGLQLVTWLKLPVVAGSTVFSLTTPTGRAFYREHRTERVVSGAVNGLPGLGQSLADGLDLYTCAAKRYFQFFTGLDVPLRRMVAPPATDVQGTIKHQLDLTIQNFVFDLAGRLKTSQSLRMLIREIIDSPTFKSRNFLATQEAP